MSDRLTRRVKLGGYAARAKVSTLPQEEVAGDVDELYEEKFSGYYSKYGIIKDAIRFAPSHARGRLWRALLRLLRLVNDKRFDDAKKEYEIYKEALARLGAAEYLDKALEAAGVLKDIVGGETATARRRRRGGGGGGAGGGETAPVL